MKKWNTSITFESHEEVVGVLSALEKYKGEYIPDGVEELIGLLDTMNQEWSRMEEELLRERLANDEFFRWGYENYMRQAKEAKRLALKGDSAEVIAEKTGLSLEDAKMEEETVKALLGVISAEEIIEQFEL
ncbi:MAG: hypothetical protein UE329_09790 [Lachnospiraceae bacterium]|jgi:hypothetical protein|nr:hypothetical protein [Lachnospiraceae bacterium]